MKTFATMIALSLALAGCANFPLSNMKGTTSVSEISPRTYSVSFCGNAYMSQDEVDKYAFQRASELTLARGYTYFVVLSKEDNSEFCAINTGGKYGRRPPSEPTDAQSYAFPPFMKPNVKLTIRCYSQSAKLPQDAINADSFLRENFPGLKE